MKSISWTQTKLKRNFQVLARCYCKFSADVYREEGPSSLMTSGFETVELDCFEFFDFVFCRIGDMMICFNFKTRTT